MKNAIIIILLISLLSCEDKTSKKEVQKETWIESFRSLRQNIYQKRSSNFMKFPFEAKTMSAWSFVESKDKTDPAISEQDFERHYFEIFEKEFIDLLLKVKSKSFEKTKQYELEKKEGNTTYGLLCEYNSETEILKTYMTYEFMEELESVESMQGFVFKKEKEGFVLIDIEAAG